MSKWALYHDFDELKCEVMREAIKARAITDGEVICGDIKQLTAEHVRGFRRVHCFAGGGFWDLALTWAGWGDRPAWTGSCPCPSFSAAGKGEGFRDPRHLWPDWARLIRECRPATVFGEQVDAAIGHGWLDLVQSDLEAEEYAVGKAVLGACSVGAPHIRKRLYFVADAQDSDRRSAGDAGDGRRRLAEVGGSSAHGVLAHSDGWLPSDGGVQRGGEHGREQEDGGVGELGEPIRTGLQGLAGDGRDGHQPGRDGAQPDGSVAAAGTPSGVENADIGRCGARSRDQPGTQKREGRDCIAEQRDEPCGLADARYNETDLERIERPTQPSGDGTNHGLFGGSGGELRGTVADSVRERRQQDPGSAPGDEATDGRTRWNGSQPDGDHLFAGHGAYSDVDPHTLHWRDCDWILCRDGKWRPVEAGTFPLATRDSPDMVLVRGDGSPDASYAATEARQGRLRLYGDAICVPVAAEFVRAYMETINAV